MASRGHLQQPMSCFTISVSLLLVVVVFALSSYQATASSSASSSSAAAAESMTSISETRRSMISLPWPWNSLTLPKDWINKPLKDILAFLNKIRKRIIDEMLKILGLPPTGDIFGFLWKAAKWLGDTLWYFLRDPRERIDTVMDWIVDSILNPFRTLTNGMKSFQMLFRYIHKLRKGTLVDFGKDNPVYKCFLGVHPGCVKLADNSVESVIIYQFYCAWLFYEKCQLHYWWKNGKWKVPDINGGDPCKLTPKGKCADDPPL